MKAIPPLLSLLALTACQAPASSSSQAALCTDTVNAYAHARDAGDIERAKTLFTEDASLTIFGQTQQGRKAILAAMQRRAEGAVSRHIIGSVVITPTGLDTASGESYVMVVIGDGTGKRPVPLSADNLFAAGTYQDTFKIEGDHCRIATRNVVVDFQKQ